MKAIILAAGIGSRLQPITDIKPKTLVCVNGRPMIEWIIDSLLQSLVDDIVVCVGYKANDLIDHITKIYGKKANIKFVINSVYDSTNNMYSLYLARDYLYDDVLIMNADLVFDHTIIRDLIMIDGSAVAVDVGLYQEESMKVVIKNNSIAGISKKIPQSDSYGCSIDIYKFDSIASDILHNEITRIIEVENDLNQWTEVLLDRVFENGSVDALAFDIGHRSWYEIDNFEDLAKAEILFNDKLKDLKLKKLFMIDKDGTLTLGDTPINGAESFLHMLNEKEKKWIIGSNNSSKTSCSHADTLDLLFPTVKNISVVGSLDVAIKNLKNMGFNKVFWLANDLVSTELHRFFTYSEVNPDALLLTYDTEINYSKLLKFIAHVRNGIPYFSTHIDMVCPTIDGDIPDIGTFIHLIATCVNKYPQDNFGKPSINFTNFLLDNSNIADYELVIIGDRLYTDIASCIGTNITSVLVLSGETSRADYENSIYKADIVVPSVETLVDYL
jgi:HAD superfamily hydrolase (TIGR01450 family)